MLSFRWLRFAAIAGFSWLLVATPLLYLMARFGWLWLQPAAMLAWLPFMGWYLWRANRDMREFIAANRIGDEN